MIKSKKSSHVSNLKSTSKTKVNQPDTSTPLTEKYRKLLGNLKGVKVSSSGHVAFCPAHQDKKRSLSTSLEGERILINCFAGCGFDRIAAALGVDQSDFFPDMERPASPSKQKPRIKEIYPYYDESGTLLYENIRFEPKDFRIRRQLKNGDYSWSAQGVRRVPYQLPQLLEAARKGKKIAVCEGEKDVQALEKFGFTATTNVNGANNWKSEFGEYFKGSPEVIIFEDNDPAGQRWTQIVAESLEGLVPKIKIIRFPELPAKGDISDWLAAGHTREDLLKRIEESPFWEPGDHQEEFESDFDDTKGLEASKIERISQASQLVHLVKEAGGELFHTSDDEGYVNLPSEGAIKTWPIRSPELRGWLESRFFELSESVPSGQAKTDAISALCGLAVHQGSQESIHLRTAEWDGKIYIDLCNEGWEVVEVGPDGWSIIQNPPVRFIRKKGMLPLARPVRGGDLGKLRELLNLSDDGWILLLGWLVAALRPTGPYPILNLIAEQGSGKSTIARLLRQLIDPHKVPLRSEPRDERDLMIAATNCWAVAYDNLSRISDGFSDSLCRLATGGGFTTRTLYTDREETFLDACCPIILTGINDLATRSDLLDRSIILELHPIPEEKRAPETELWRRFSALQPLILGSLMDAVQCGLGRLDSIQLSRLPRMADFALWVAACSPALGFGSEEFLEIYSGNRSQGHDLALELTPISRPLEFLVDEIEGHWSGRAGDLLAGLNRLGFDTEKNSRSWPKDAIGLAKMLRRISPNLRNRGIKCEFHRVGKNRERLIELLRVENDGNLLSAPSAPSARVSNTSFINGLPADSSADSDPSKIHSLSALSANLSAVNPFEINKADGADRTDSENPTLSSDTEDWEVIQ